MKKGLSQEVLIPTWFILWLYRCLESHIIFYSRKTFMVHKVLGKFYICAWI